MVAVQDGKVIVAHTGDNAIFYSAKQDSVDEFIAAGKTFGEVIERGELTPSNLSVLRHDDGTIIAESDQIDVQNVNRSSDIWIFVEPQFIIANA